VAELSLVGFDEAAFLRLLNRRVEKPVLNEREKRIMALLEGEHGDRIGEVSEVFRDSATAYCPYCFRDIAATEKTTLVEGVEKVLNRTVEEYREELKSVVFPDFSFDYERYEVVDPEIAQEAKAAVDTCVAIVGLYREDVVAKEGNVYGVSDIPGRGLSAAVAVANEKLRLVEERRVNAAAMAKRKSDIELDLFRLYKEKAHYGVQKDYAAYERQTKESADKRRVRDELSRAAEAKQAELDALESKKAGTDIAVDCINESLRYIFADKDRFTVEPKNGEYVLKSRRHDVCPADVSTGERHILALAYFFVDIMANHAKKDFYKDERILVIDDPVSSYDQENRIGVYSFLAVALGRSEPFGEEVAGGCEIRELCVFDDVASLRIELLQLEPIGAAFLVEPRCFAAGLDAAGPEMLLDAVGEDGGIALVDFGCLRQDESAAFLCRDVGKHPCESRMQRDGDDFAV